MAEVTMNPPVTSIYLEEWVAEVLREWQREKRSGPLILHHLNGSIKTVEAHVRTERPVREG